MSRFALMVFPDEARATEAVRSLEALHRGRDVALHGAALIRRDLHGALCARRRNDAPLGVGVAALLGALMKEFLACIEHELPPGSIAVIAELAEHGLTPVEAVVRPLGGTVAREWGDDFLGQLLERRTRGREARLAARASEPALTELERIARHLTRLVTGEQEKLERAAEDLRGRLEGTREQIDASIGALERHAAYAPPDARRRTHQHVAALRHEYLARERRIAAICREIVEREQQLRPLRDPELDGVPRDPPGQSSGPGPAPAPRLTCSGPCSPGRDQNGKPIRT